MPEEMLMLIRAVLTENSQDLVPVGIYTLQSACSCLYLAGTFLRNMTSGSSKLTATSHCNPSPPLSSYTAS